MKGTRLEHAATAGPFRAQGSSSPQDPILIHMVRTPCKAGLPEHDQNRAGRAELLATSCETFERNIRDQLGRTLKDGGFDSAGILRRIVGHTAMLRNTTRCSIPRFPRSNSRMYLAALASAALPLQTLTREAPHTRLGYQSRLSSSE